MDAGKSAQELVHMTDEGSMQLPQSTAPEVDETIKWMATDGKQLPEGGRKQLDSGGQSDVNIQQLFRQVTVFTGDDAGKAAATMAEPIAVMQKTLLSTPESSEHIMDVAKQAEMLTAAVPNAQPLMQTQTMLEMNMGGMQLQAEQQRMLMQQVQNSTMQQSRSVQVNNHLNPNISITFGDVRESADVDEVARRLRLCLLEEMQRCGEGVW